jgi:hypothetical protein
LKRKLLALKALTSIGLQKYSPSILTIIIQYTFASRYEPTSSPHTSSPQSPFLGCFITVRSMLPISIPISHPTLIRPRTRKDPNPLSKISNSRRKEKVKFHVCNNLYIASHTHKLILYNITSPHGSLHQRNLRIPQFSTQITPQSTPPKLHAQIQIRVFFLPSYPYRRFKPDPAGSPYHSSLALIGGHITAHSPSFCLPTLDLDIRSLERIADFDPPFLRSSSLSRALGKFCARETNHISFVLKKEGKGRGFGGLPP